MLFLRPSFATLLRVAGFRLLFREFARPSL
jgi:hypothetical protein